MRLAERRMDLCRLRRPREDEPRVGVALGPRLQQLTWFGCQDDVLDARDAPGVIESLDRAKSSAARYGNHHDARCLLFTGVRRQRLVDGVTEQQRFQAEPRPR